MDHIPSCMLRQAEEDIVGGEGEKWNGCGTERIRSETVRATRDYRGSTDRLFVVKEDEMEKTRGTVVRSCRSGRDWKE